MSEGDYVEIQKDHITIYQAEIINIEEIDLYNLSESQKTLMMLDCGCNWSQAADTVEHFCNSNKVAVITLLKLMQ